MKTARKWFSMLLVLAMLLSMCSVCFSASAEDAVSPVHAQVAVPETIYLKPGSTQFQYYLDGYSVGTKLSPTAKTRGTIRFVLSQAASSITVSCSGASSITLSSMSATDTSELTATITDGAASSASSGVLTWTFTYVINGTTYNVQAYTYIYSPYLGQVGAQAGYQYKTAIGNEPVLAATAFIAGIHSVTGGAYTSLLTGTSSVNMSPLVEGWGDANVPVGEENGTLTNWTNYFAQTTDGTGGFSIAGLRERAADTSVTYGNQTTYGVLNVDVSRYAGASLSTIPNFSAGWMIHSSRYSADTHELASFSSASNDLQFTSGSVEYINGQTAQAFGPTAPVSGTVPSATRDYPINAQFAFKRASSSTVRMTLQFALRVVTVDKSSLRATLHDALYLNCQNTADAGYAAYRSAIAAAAAVLGQPDASQADVESASSLLSDAVAGLSLPQEPVNEDPTVSIVVPETIYLTPGARTMQYFIEGAKSGTTPSIGKSSSGAYMVESNKLVSNIQVSCTTASIETMQADPSKTQAEKDAFAAGFTGTLSRPSASNVTTFYGALSGASAPSAASDLLIWTFDYTIGDKSYTSKAYSYIYAPYLGQTGAQGNYTYKTTIGNEPKLCVYSFIAGIHSTAGGPYRSNFTGTGYDCFRSPLVPDWSRYNVPAANIDSNCELENVWQYYSNDTNGGVTYVKAGRDRDGSTSVEFGNYDGYGLLTVDASRYTGAQFSAIPNFGGGVMVFGSVYSSETHRLASFTGVSDSSGANITLAESFDYAMGETGLAYGPFAPTGTVPAVSTRYNVDAVYEMRRSASSTCTMTYKFGLQVNIVNKAVLRTKVQDSISALYQASDYNAARFAAYESALRSASLVLGRPDTTQSQIDDAIDLLDAAEANLSADVHNFVIMDHPATCTSEGYTIYTCTSCGITYRIETADAFGHDYVVTSTTASTCTVRGVKRYDCTRCSSFYTETLPLAAHSYGSWTQVDAQKHERICTACGYIARGSHNYVEDTAQYVVPSETEDIPGTRVYVCSYCGATKSEIVASPVHTTHSYRPVVTSPTCTAQGYTTYYCTKCTESYVDENSYTPALGHVWGSGTVTKEATCTQKGTLQRSCTRCNAVDTIDVAALGHDYVEQAVIEPTCTEAGYTEYKCSRCANIDTDKYTPALGHTWDDGVVTTQPTYETEGVKTYTCTRCCAMRFETIPQLVCSHSDYHYVVITQANCAMHTDGLERKICNECGAVLEENVLRWQDAHDFSRRATIVEPTCTQTGVAQYFCTICGESEGLDYTIMPLGHVFDSGVVTLEPTCIEAGEMTFTCSRCAETMTQEIAPDPDAHAWDAGVVTTQPTYEAEGVKTYTCTLCSATRTEVIPPLPVPPQTGTIVVSAETAHPGTNVQVTVSVQDNPGIVATRLFVNYDADVLTPVSAVNGTIFPDSTAVFSADNRTLLWEDSLSTVNYTATGTLAVLTFRAADDAPFGSTAITLTVDGDSTFDTDLNNVGFLVQNGGVTLAHAYEAVVTAPTCTTGGFTTYTCSVCGDSYTADETEPLGHHFDHGVVTTDPTCTEKGEITYTCSHCSETYTEEIDALGHDYIVETVDPTCWEGGYTKTTCSRCDYEEISDETHALDHDWGDGVVTTEPTCTEKGEMTYMCSRCCETYTEEIDALGHDFYEEAIEATCTEGGYTLITCSRCDYESIENLTDALGHDWYDGVVTTIPTCTEAGEITYTCSRCDATKTEEIEADGHDYQETVVAPTCTEGGYTLITCSRCDYESIEYWSDPLGHDWDEGVVTTNPTCTEKGEKTFTCSRCYETYTEEIDALCHDWDEGVVTTEATYWKAGEITYTCARCGDTYTEAIPQLDPPADSGRLVVSGSRGFAGYPVDVTVSVQDNPGLIAARMFLDYDPSVLTLVGVTNGEVMGGATFIATNNLAAVPFTVLWEDSLATENHTADGTLVTFTFLVAADAPLGSTTVTLTYDETSTYNTNEEDQFFFVDNGSVNIVERVAGDTNGDGELNAKDVTNMRRALAGWDGYEVDPCCADVNGDGVVNLKDVTLITRYLAGWPVNLY